MNIQILDSWLREHLKTKAGPKEIARFVSLSGPTFDRTEKITLKSGRVDWLYDIEVTTNRVDAMSVRGIAREAAVVLPEFGYPAKLIPLRLKKPAPPKKRLPLRLNIDRRLVSRVMGVVLEIDSIGKSPDWLRDRLEASGIRSLNTAVDITNYVMMEIGHPTHVFDYDLIKPKIFLRLSTKGEKIISLENKEYLLPGGDIVIDNDRGEIVDLPGIIGTKNSIVNKNTKRVLFFLETNDPFRIRRTSMTLGIRTVAATLNEKGVDANLAESALYFGVELFRKLLKAKPVSKVYDLYPQPYRPHSIKLKHHFIEKRMGTPISVHQVVKILKALEFQPKINPKTKAYSVKVPSFRSKDVTIPEDIVEEVARIYGYHNLPGQLMISQIPETTDNPPFDFEISLKRLLVSLGGNEVYTLSLVPQSYTKNALGLKNPLGTDSEYLRTSLAPSLIKAAQDNAGEKDRFFLFEMANVYLPKKNKLPEEKMMLSVIFFKYSFREAKGIIETLLSKLNTEAQFIPEDANGFLTNQRISLKASGKALGQFGTLDSGFIYAEFNLKFLREASRQTRAYQPIPKYPPQIEDITLTLPNKTRVGEVLSSIRSSHSNLARTELVDIYKDAYTIRVWYQDSTKTLTNKEVEKTREAFLARVKNQFGISLKE